MALAALLLGCIGLDDVALGSGPFDSGLLQAAWSALQVRARIQHMRIAHMRIERARFDRHQCG